nr:hypothetical protein [Pseudomonas veronii]
MIEDTAPGLVLGPGHDRLVALRLVAEPRKGLIAVARRVEEVERLAAREAVARRRHVDPHPVLGHDVARLQDVVPRIEEERQVVQAGALAADEGNVVRLARMRQERRQLERAVRSHRDLLGLEEVERLDEEPGVFRDLVDAVGGVEFAHQQAVVEPVRAGTAHVVRPRVGVGRADVGADAFLLRKQAHLVPAGHGKPEHAPAVGQAACR